MQNSLTHPVLFFFFGIIVLFGSGCPSTLLNRQQLHGADPQRDLVAASMINALKKIPSTKISVLGVRLMDPIERVKKLWGPPSVSEKDHLLWKDKDGNYLLRIVLGRKMHKDSQNAQGDARKRPIKWLYVVRQIDLFSSFQKKLHPHNRPLLISKHIRSTTWRKKILGVPGRPLQDALRERYIFLERGYRWILFSKSFPLYQRVSAVFSIFVPTSVMTTLGIFPMS